MSIVACSEAGCPSPVAIKKWSLCRTHYDRAYHSGRIERGPKRPTAMRLLESFTCKNCGEYHPERQAEMGKRQRARKFCDKKCGAAYHAAIRAASKRSERSERKCKECGCDISHRAPQATFCSTTCSDVHRGSRLAKPLDPIACALEGCEVVFVPKGRHQKCCSENHGAIHCKRKGRAEGRYKPEPWNDRRKAQYQKRRAAKRTTAVEDIRPIDIFERDVWLCGICNAAVDHELSHPDPMSPSLDHIVPLAKGGTHTWENLQLAHLVCNVRKGDKLAA